DETSVPRRARMNLAQLHADLIGSASGGRTIAFPRLLMEILGDYPSAIVLNDCLYWSMKYRESRDGWFYRTAEQWLEEAFVSRKQMVRAIDYINGVSGGSPVIERELRKVNGAPTMHFRVNPEAYAVFIEIGTAARDADQEMAKATG